MKPAPAQLLCRRFAQIENLLDLSDPYRIAPALLHDKIASHYIGIAQSEADDSALDHRGQFNLPVPQGQDFAGQVPVLVSAEMRPKSPGMPTPKIRSAS